MSGPDAGAMDREVVIQQLAESAGSSGFPVETWTSLGEPEWMEKLSTTGGERFVAAQSAAQVQTRWRMYWREDMDPDSVDVQKKRRLLYQGRIYDITGVIETGRREGIELMTMARSEVEP